MLRSAPVSAPRSAVETELFPVTLVPDVSTALSTPFPWIPNGTRMRRTAVVAVNPDVTVAVPAVKAGNPHVARAASRNNLYGTRRRRADANDDLRVSGADRQKECRSCEKKLVLDLQVVPPDFFMFRCRYAPLGLPAGGRAMFPTGQKRVGFWTGSRSLPLR